MSTSWRETMPEFLHFLEGKLNHRVQSHYQESGFDIYLVDFSEWRLRFPSNTPIISVSQSDLASTSTQTLAQSILDVIRARQYGQRNPIALIPADGTRLRDYFRTSFQSVLVLDANEQRSIQSSRRPTFELIAHLSKQLPLSRLAPYETSNPVTGSRFFGRTSDIRRILTNEETNFAIPGIRRIGKTSLLKEIQRRLIEQSQEQGDERVRERVIYMDCSAIRSSLQLVEEVVRKFRPAEVQRIGHHEYPLYLVDFLQRMAKLHRGKLVFLLDEFDSLLTSPAYLGELRAVFRAVSNMDSVRFIIAGYRRLMQQMGDLESPLYNFARQLRLTEFTREEAGQMIIDPMRNLGVQIEKPQEIVERIFEATSGQPNLIQFFCSHLVERLDYSAQRVISPDDLPDILKNDDLRSFLLNTFLDNTNHLEKAMVYTLLETGYEKDSNFDLETIEKSLQVYNQLEFVSDLDKACRNLEMAGIFSKQGQHYRFASQVFPVVLKESYNISHLLRKVLEEGIYLT